MSRRKSKHANLREALVEGVPVKVLGLLLITTGNKAVKMLTGKY